MSQITDGLVNDGETTHFAISYESSLDPGDGRSVAQGLMNVVEDDLAVIRDWFGDPDFKYSYRINIELHNAGGGADWESPPDILSWPFFHPTVTVKAVGNPAPEERGLDYVRYLLVSEVTEMFMASLDNGWYEHTTLFTWGDEGSKGEGLSRFLGHQFCLVKGLTPWFPGELVVPSWLTQGRPDEIDSSPDDPRSPVAVGGTTCFLYYLHDQLGFSIPAIIAAGANTLALVYQNLTGRTDAAASFNNLVNVLHYPPAPTSGSIIGDNMFPVPNLLAVGLIGTGIRAGNSGQLAVGLDRVTSAAVTVRLSSDDPTRMQVPDTVTVVAGESRNVVPVQALPVPGPRQVITVHAVYAGVTVSEAVTVVPAPSGIVGVITDADTDASINTADVFITSPASAKGDVHTWELRTGPDGSYTTGPDGIEPGGYTIAASAAGHVPVTITVTVIEGVPTTRGDVSLPGAQPVTVRGTVTDQAHQPLPGAFVSIQSGIWSLTTTTDSTGTYTLDLSPDSLPVGPFVLSAELDGHVPAETAIPSLPNGATLTEDLVLPALGGLTGLITDAATSPATPVAGAEVGLVTVTDVPGFPPGYSATSDATGRYTVPQHLPGPATVTITAAGYDIIGPTTIIVPSGATLTQNFTLVKATGTVTGTVTGQDPNGGPPEPLPARISITGTPLHGADINGNFTVHGVPAGHPMITITAVGFHTFKTTLDVTAGQTLTEDYTLQGLGNPRT